MLLIHCPYCAQDRDEAEFAYSGEAHIVRPPDPSALDDAAWADYLFYRSNPRGWQAELWYHSSGCRRYFNVRRNTVSYAIAATYPMGAPQPGSQEDNA